MFKSLRYPSTSTTLKGMLSVKIISAMARVICSLCGADNFFDVLIKDVIDSCLLDKLVGELGEVWSSDRSFSRIWLRMLLVPPVQDS